VDEEREAAVLWRRDVQAVERVRRERQGECKMREREREKKKK
jgi:hypothetical protein